MWKRLIGRGIGTAALAAAASLTVSAAALAADYEEIAWGPGLQPGDYAVQVSEGGADIYVSMDSYDILKTALPGETFDIVGDEGGGWMEITVGEGVGYISAEQVTILEGEEASRIRQDETVQAQIREEEENVRRRQAVDYALQFLGCRYADGGTDPHSGVDCSGFIRYVMEHAVGISLPRSSASQAGQGITVSADQIQPGDLIFYGKGGRVNHVAMYIGDGQVVHASTYKTGVKISDWNYRTPIRIADLFGA